MMMVVMLLLLLPMLLLPFDDFAFVGERSNVMQRNATQSVGGRLGTPLPAPERYCRASTAATTRMPDVMWAVFAPHPVARAVARRKRRDPLLLS